MDWTPIKLGIKWLFGGKTAVVQYGLDIANTFAVGLKDSSRARAASSLQTAKKVLNVLEKAERYCPAKWTQDYRTTVAAFKALADSLEDLQLTAEEVQTVAKAFRLAYSEWMTP